MLSAAGIGERLTGVLLEADRLLKSVVTPARAGEFWGS
jgi:hypothetical protein